MNVASTHRRASTACLLLALIAGCAPLTEEELAEREYRLGELRAEFLEYRERCKAIGGTVVIRSRGRANTDGMPNIGDRYHCQVPR